MWFTEAAWPPILVLGTIAVVLLAMGWAQSKFKLLIAGGLLVLACGAVYFIERAIVTDGEQVEQRVLDLTSDFQHKRRDEVLSYFSPQAMLLQAIVVTALDQVDLGEDFVVRDMHVQLLADRSRAISRFRANGRVSFRGTDIGHQPSLWDVTWQREADTWKIIRVQRLHPITERALGVFEAGSR